VPSHRPGGPPSASSDGYSRRARICSHASPPAPWTLGTAIGTRRCALRADPHAHPFLTC
jgi:hypothetical protein